MRKIQAAQEIDLLVGIACHGGEGGELALLDRRRVGQRRVGRILRQSADPKFIM
jgi:hypothetical protein